MKTPTQKKIKAWAVVDSFNGIYAIEEEKVYAKMEKDRFIAGISKDFKECFNDLRILPRTVIINIKKRK